MKGFFSAKRIWRFGPAVFATVAVLALSLLPACCFRGVEESLPLFPGLDKVVHAAMYAGLVAAWSHVVPPANRGWRPIVRIAMVATLFGLVVEVGQKVLTRTRCMDPLDGCANAAGAFLCAGLIGAAWGAPKRKGDSSGGRN